MARSNLISKVLLAALVATLVSSHIFSKVQAQGSDQDYPEEPMVQEKEEDSPGEWCGDNICSKNECCVAAKKNMFGVQLTCQPLAVENKPCIAERTPLEKWTFFTLCDCAEGLHCTGRMTKTCTKSVVVERNSRFKKPLMVPQQ